MLTGFHRSRISSIIGSPSGCRALLFRSLAVRSALGDRPFIDDEIDGRTKKKQVSTGPIDISATHRVADGSRRCRNMRSKGMS